MDISRRGSSADHGPSSINLKDPSVSWNEINKVVEIKKGRVKDFSGKSHHNYKVSLSLDDVANIIHAVASAANTNPELLAEMQEQTLKSLLQIQAAIVGCSNQNTTINR